MSPLPDHVERVLEQGECNADDVLPRGEVNRLLEPGYLPLETGYAALPDGTTHVAVLTRFPGATGEMIDWWFGWHGLETERYKLWHPQAHLYSQMRCDRTQLPNLTDRQKYLGNTSYVDEYVGPQIHRLAIAFGEPRQFGLAEESFKDAGVSTAICARVGFSDKPIDSGYLVHLIRETPEGCEMRSRFWMGDVHVRALPERNPIDPLLAARFVRRLMIPGRLARDLLIHCAEEMNHLASFLPALFAQQTGSSSERPDAGRAPEAGDTADRNPLRPASQADVRTLTAIRREAILSLATSVMDGQRARAWAGSSADERVHRAIEQNEVWVAERENAAAGWVEVDGNRVEGIYVRPDLAGNGIGSALLLHAEGLIRSAGQPAIALDSSSNAESFYLRRGYEALADESADGGRPMLEQLGALPPDVSKNPPV